MDFRPGDVQLLKNSSILHARTEYQDEAAPAQRRHLLRFWLSARGGFSGSDVRLKQGIEARDGAPSDRDAIEASGA